MTMRSLAPYAAIWTLFCIMLGVVIAPALTGPGVEDHSTHFTHDHSMTHGVIEVDPEGAPELDVLVVKDNTSGWNLMLETTNFRFAPEAVNGDHVPGEGHAHIYLNGAKLTRLYGHHYYLSDLPPGEHVIGVTLNANDHSDLFVDGVPVASSAEITVPGDE